MAGTLRSRLERARTLARAAGSPAAGTAPGRNSDAPEGGGAGRPAPGSEGASGSAPEGRIPNRAPGDPGLGEGWTEAAPYLWTRYVLRDDPLPETLDLRPYAPGGAAFGGREAGRPGEIRTPFREPEIRSDRLLFFDLETTGLSGGAGTVAFLAALGRVSDRASGGGLGIRQYLLTDYPGEGTFLDALLASMTPGTILASYNGRAFDEPLLRTRCVLNRRSFGRFPHVDFLHPARRLWRGLYPDCSLGTLERHLLGTERVLDVPGERIPEIWFAFLKDGFHPLMEAVAEHNRTDIESLAGLAAACARVHANPVHAGPCNRTALGALWIRLEPELGVEILEEAFREGDEKAGWLLLAHYRRKAEMPGYERILAALPSSFQVLVERAKHSEHRLRDYPGALECARDALAQTKDPAARDALAVRLERLKRRISATPPRGGRTGPPR